MRGVPGAHAPGFAEIGPSGLVRASGAKRGFRGVVWASGPRFVGWACPRLRFRPETSISGSPGRSHRHDPFCRCHGSKDCSAPPTPNGPTATHNLAAGNVQGTGIRAPEAVPEFTANAFADHHRRMRLASNCEPKTMDSLRCSGGMPSTTPHVVGNDKASARAQTSRHPWNPQCVSRGWSRAGMTQGTKVVLWRQNDFNSLNNAVFFEGWAGQECPGYLFVPRRQECSGYLWSPRHSCPAQPVAHCAHTRPLPA